MKSVSEMTREELEREEALCVELFGFGQLAMRSAVKRFRDVRAALECVDSKQEDEV